MLKVPIWFASQKDIDFCHLKRVLGLWKLHLWEHCYRLLCCVLLKQAPSRRPSLKCKIWLRPIWFASYNLEVMETLIFAIMNKQVLGIWRLHLWGLGYRRVGCVQAPTVWKARNVICSYEFEIWNRIVPVWKCRLSFWENAHHHFRFEIPCDVAFARIRGKSSNAYMRVRVNGY